MARLISAFKQFFDGEGNPLISGHLDFFESGSSTMRKTTFADAAQKIKNPNPVPLLADGRAPNIFGTGSYRVILRTAAGSQIQLRDPVGDTPLYTAVKTEDTQRASQTALADDPHLKLTLPANSRYKVSGYIKFFTPNSSGGTGIRFIPNSADILNSSVMPIFSNISGSSFNASLMTEGNTTSYSGSGIDEEAAINFRGFIETGPNSVLWAIAWSQDTTSTDANILRANSWIRAEPTEIG